MALQLGVIMMRKMPQQNLHVILSDSIKGKGGNVEKSMMKSHMEKIHTASI